MEQKHVKKMLQAYVELGKERADISYPQTFEEHEEELKEVYYKFLTKYPLDEAIEFLLTDLTHDEGFRIYVAFSKYDMEFLNDALYENAHLYQVGNILQSGADHTFYSYNIMPELLAANMIDRIPQILPKEHGMCNSNVVGTAVVDLFMAIWYQDEEFKKTAIEVAEKKLNTKLAQYDRAYVLYLKALLEKDVEEASLQLEEMCAGHKKSRMFGTNSFNKAFAVGVHGMYNLSQHVYDGEFRGKVRMPKADNFCQDLALWQQENGYKPGRVIHTYSEPIEFINAIMSIEPPVMQLFKRTAKESRLNCELYAEEVVSRVLEKLNEKK